MTTSLDDLFEEDSFGVSFGSFEIKKHGFTIKNLEPMNINGYTDMSGDWFPIKGYYFKDLNKRFYTLNHNYNIKIHRINKQKWHLIAYLCLTASNSNEIKIIDQELTRYGDCKRKIVEFINEYDKSQKSWDDIEKWKSEHAQPVFVLENEEPKLIGTTYNYIGRDTCKKEDKDVWLYFNDDMPDYGYYGTYYQLTTSNSKDKIVIWKVRLYGGGYGSGGLKDDELLAKMLNLVKNNPKYKYLLGIANK